MGVGALTCKQRCYYSIITQTSGVQGGCAGCCGSRAALEMAAGRSARPAGCSGSIYEACAVLASDPQHCSSCFFPQTGRSMIMCFKRQNGLIVVLHTTDVYPNKLACPSRHSLTWPRLPTFPLISSLELKCTVFAYGDLPPRSKSRSGCKNFCSFVICCTQAQTRTQRYKKCVIHVALGGWRPEEAMAR